MHAEVRRSAAAVVIACACTPSELVSDEREDEVPRTVVRPAPAPLEPVAFDGDCSAGPPMGPLDAYAGASATVVGNSTSERVRVRVCAVWPADDLRNALGTLPSGRRVPVFGPVKHPLFSAGIGYVVPLVDARGQRCRGYISQTVLEQIERHGSRGDRPPLPDASPAWLGPCLLEG